MSMRLSSGRESLARGAAWSRRLGRGLGAQTARVHQLLLLLSREKQLGQTLGHMEVVKAELERRGLRLAE